MTISPRAKVIGENAIPVDRLVSGIDTLNLSIEAVIVGDNFFKTLDEHKGDAQKHKRESLICLRSRKGDEETYLGVHAYGSNGYSWLLTGAEYALKIGNWRTAKSRPNILIEIRSETLWRFGPAKACNRLLEILRNYDVDTKVIKVSRVDLCMDLLFPAEHWNSASLVPYAVTRCRNTSLHAENNELTGISLGHGHISARLYDKAREIKKSGKEWFFDIWEIESVPENKLVIRVEFQLRREALKELEIDRLHHLFQNLEKIWAYCTQKWLKFRTNPGKHHTQKRTFGWWKFVQNNFLGIFNPPPLIRAKAINAKKEQLRSQVVGLLTSLFALDLDESQWSYNPPASKEEFLISALDQVLLTGISGEKLLDDVLAKSAKYRRGKSRDLAVHKARISKGFPSNYNDIPEENPNE